MVNLGDDHPASVELELLKIVGVDGALRGNGLEPRVVAQAAASAMTLTAPILDIASTPAKGLIDAESWFYQRLELAGSVLSGTASFIEVGCDFFDVVKNTGRKRYGFAALYTFKMRLGPVLN